MFWEPFLRVFWQWRNLAFRICLSSLVGVAVLIIFSAANIWAADSSLSTSFVLENHWTQGALMALALCLPFMGLLVAFMSQSTLFVVTAVMSVGALLVQAMLSGYGAIWLWPAALTVGSYVEVLGVVIMGFSAWLLMPLFVSIPRPKLLLGVVIWGCSSLVLAILSMQSWYFWALVGYEFLILLVGIFCMVRFEALASKGVISALKLAWSLNWLILGMVSLQRASVFRGDVLNWSPQWWLLSAHVMFFFTAFGRYLELMRQDRMVVLDQLRQVDERKQWLQKSDRLKDNFLEMVGQELRAPLIGVIGGLDLMQPDDLSPKQCQFWKSAKRSADQLHVLMNKLLRFTELQTQKMMIVSETFNVADMIALALDKYQALCDYKGLELRIERGPGLPRVLQADSERLVQLITDLMDNALKFTFSGYIGFSVKVLELNALNKGEFGEHKQKVQICFEVTDTGIGIPSEWLKILFDPYALSEHMDRRQFGDLGLSLAHAKQFCVLQGGGVAVDSESGQGTKVKAWLMLDKVQEVARSDKRSLSELISAYGGSVRALIVEDNLVNQMVLSGLLGTLSVLAQCADHGEQALEVLKRSAQEGEQRFQIILMDCQMPVMDGFTATQAIRASREYYSQLPIIAVTANADPETQQQCFDSGMDDYITKPFGTDTLEQVLRTALVQQAPWPEQDESRFLAAGE